MGLSAQLTSSVIGPRWRCFRLVRRMRDYRFVYEAERGDPCACAFSDSSCALESTSCGPTHGEQSARLSLHVSIETAHDHPFFSQSNMPPSRIPSSAGLPLNPMTANYGSAKVGGTASPTTNGDARSRRPGVTLRAGTTAAAAVAAGAGGLNKTAGSAGVGGVEIEDFGPPEWRPVLNARADLGGDRPPD